MKQLLRIAIVIACLSFSCKKDKKTDPEPTPTPVTCTPKTTGVYEGKYATLMTSTKDTIQLSFVQDNCPDSTIRYKIVGLGKAFNSWGSPIQDRAYYVNINEYIVIKTNDDINGSISDTLKVRATSTGVSFSCKYKGSYTPYLSFLKVK